jgi:hypothetical protein
MLTVFHRAPEGAADPDAVTSSVIAPARFVPLIGNEGFS